MTVFVINGPNLNLLGIRQPEIYGHESYQELCARLRAYGEARGVTLRLYQSNHEGDLVDCIQSAWGSADGIVINPGAYAHTSVALLDALLAVGLPAVEVHISDPERREPFRHVSYLREACLAVIAGHGTAGYFEAIDLLLERAKP